MNWIPIKSSKLSAGAYEASIKTMHLKFQNGEEYEYPKVPESIFWELINALSQDEYYDNFIKDSYRCNKI